MKILTINNKKEEKFLRQKTADFDVSLLRNPSKKKEIQEIIKRMRETMTAAIGIGLSANQIGLNLRLFVAQIPENRQFQEVRPPEINPQYLGGRTSKKFYAIFNPEIIKFSEKKTIMEEGCLSAPGIYGSVERPEKITLAGYDKNGKKIKIKAFGLLARVFQHETDHLNGVLFIDKCKKIYKIPAVQLTGQR